ncbi:GNAT family N-acetyltransferase [Neobacillus sp.]|uniref:GNAT family N-acetyltransferase n=1 Tax=Neobacillus sp. TaxID=2675273 RepID=UPI00289A6C00|nr:GNAT family N-acetyltransferase [Neobacillus sp.]
MENTEFKQTITLKEVNLDNFRACIRLKVAGDQEKFIASNLFTIAESKVDHSMTPYAIYANETLVGFCCLEYVPENAANDRYGIPRFMIGEEFQGKGYGKQAMEEIISMLSKNDDCIEISLSYVPENQAARNFYLSLGFVDQGEKLSNENVLHYFVTE